MIVDADNVNHVVIFMTGQIPFPEGSAGLSKSSTVFLRSYIS